jgi:hypothetical protein
VNAQQQARAILASDRVAILDVPDAVALDASDRIGALAALGEPLRAALESAQSVRRFS